MKKQHFLQFELVITILLFVVVFGMRYDVGVDYLNYLNIYERHDNTVNFELLFKYITVFCKELNLHYTVYFSIIVFIQIFFFFYAFEKEKYLFPFLVFFLFTNGNWLFLMNVIRQAIAICIWLYSIKYIENKSFKWYFFWIIIAFLFHRSAIVLIIFYPIMNRDFIFFQSISIQLVLLVIVFTIRLYFYDLLMYISPIVEFYQSLWGDHFYSGYKMEKLMTSFKDQEGTGIAFLFKIAVNILIILYSSRLKLFYASRRFNIIYFFYFIGVITLYIFPAGFISITRPFRYFYFMQCIMFAYFLFYLYKNNTKDNNILFPILIVSFSFIFYLNLFTVVDDAHILYQFFFQRH